MRSADTGSNVPGGHALPQRLTHINSHNALASGHRTLEELLTALRKVARCIVPFMSVACRPLLQSCCLALCAPCNLLSVQRHEFCETPYFIHDYAPALKTCCLATGGGSAQAWTPGEAQDALLPPGRSRHTSHVEVLQWQAAQHHPCKRVPGVLYLSGCIILFLIRRLEDRLALTPLRLGFRAVDVQNLHRLSFLRLQQIHGTVSLALINLMSLVCSGRWCLVRQVRISGDTRCQIWREPRSHCCTQTPTNQYAPWTLPAAASRSLSSGTEASM